jgi:hypothetical protein
MSQSSLAVVIYDPRSLHPPPAFIFMELLHDIIVIENALLHAQHPHHVHDMLSDLRHMFATMHYLANWSLCRRVSCLQNRARVVIFRLCHEYVLRCAVLVDACRLHQHRLLCRNDYTSDCIYCRHAAVDLLCIPPSYDAMALAVAACDDVLHYLRPLCKSFYLNDLRPCLVEFMAHSDSSGYESILDSAAHVDLPVPKRLCA